MAAMQERANGTRRFIGLIVLFAMLSSSLPCPAAATLRIATYNLENYRDKATAARPEPKSASSKARIRECIRKMNPDVLALEEVGSLDALMELRASLKAEGLAFPNWEFVNGGDTNIHIAVLSKLPVVARRPHTNEIFLLDGRRFRVERGFAELDIQAATHFTFTLVAAHLKSRRPVPGADEAEQRFQEAKILRRIINRELAANPDAKLIVLGDFNDVKDSDSIREIIGTGRFGLIDTRPAERNGDNKLPERSHSDPRNITWTHYYGKEDTYSRVDYILLSSAMAGNWVKDETYVLAAPNWGMASDHRPIVAAFKTGD